MTMRCGLGVLAAVLALAGEAAAQTPPAQPPPLTLDAAAIGAAPAPAPRDRAPRWDWSSSLDLTATCPTCPTGSRPPATNGNAPWLWGARVRFGDDRHWIAVGVVGQRNVQRPLYMTQSIGGAPQPDTPSSATPLGDTRTTWRFVLQSERTLWRSRRGATAGVVGEVFLPWGVVGATPPAVGAPTPSSRAARGAFRVRF